MGTNKSQSIRLTDPRRTVEQRRSDSRRMNINADAVAAEKITGIRSDRPATEEDRNNQRTAPAQNDAITRASMITDK